MSGTMTYLPDLRLTWAAVLHDGALKDTARTIAQGQFQGNLPTREVDLSGYWLLPGIIGLHGDGFGHHLRSRPTAPFDTRRAQVSADIRVQIRFETHMLDDHDNLVVAMARFRVEQLVFNNHLFEAVFLADNNPDRFSIWAGHNSHSPDTHVTPASYCSFRTAITACSWPPPNPVREKYSSSLIPICLSSQRGNKYPDVEFGSA